MDEYLRVMKIVETGSVDELERLAAEKADFPEGIDPYIGSRWVINAVSTGSAHCVRWMLSRRVDLDFTDEEGSTVLHCAIDRQYDDRHALLEELILAGAPLNRKGFNDWTPLHLAAARDDVEALRILVKHGADLSVRTGIDDYATPLEEARTLGRINAVRYLESIEGASR